MKDDHEYFQTHFVVAQLLMEKVGIANQLWQRNDKTGCLSQAHYQAQKDIEIINEWIRDEECRLREEIHTAIETGKVFAFEVLAQELNLSDFERRLILFLFYADLFSVEVIILPRRVLGFVLDCDGTIQSRGKTLLNMFTNGALFEKGIVEKYSAGAPIRLSAELKDKLRALVSGETICEARQENKKTDCDVGFFCEPEYGMDDVILTDEIKNKVLIHLDTHQRLIEIGALDKVKRGRGICMLFYGPPGTGKSLLSHALARHLKKKVLQATYSEIQSMWLGECEKNISSLFKIATEKGAVLCIDEVDSLLLDRNESKRSFEIAQVNTLLEEIERFDGVLIMTTNLENRLDPAVERRISLRVRFDAPTADIREKIWQSHLPENLKIDNSVCWRDLAEKYTFSGGYIKNAVLSALRHMIARNSQIITQDDLIHGAEIEFQGMLRRTNKGPMGFSMR